MAPKNQSINSSTSYGSPHFILLLQEVTWQSRSFLPAGWLKGLCIWKRSRQQLNNLYWVAYKSFICCDYVQLNFEPWTDEASNGETCFQIKVSHNRKDLIGWLLSFISNHSINPKRRLRILFKDPNYCHLSQRCLKTKFPREHNKSSLNSPIHFGLLLNSTESHL